MKVNLLPYQLRKIGLIGLVGVVLGWWQLSPNAYSQTTAQTVNVHSDSSHRHLSQDMDTLLSATQIQKELGTLPGWQSTGKAIYRTFMFDNFLDAIAFINQLVEPAETSGHHPDLNISYNRVVVTLTTHDVGGLTTKDTSMAHTVTQVYIESVSN